MFINMKIENVIFSLFETKPTQETKVALKSLLNMPKGYKSKINIVNVINAQDSRDAKIEC
jgi:hypothetical protein